MIVTLNKSVDKSSFLSHNKLEKPVIAIFCIFLMVGGFLFSRALLSIGMVLFGINSLWNIPPSRWLDHKWWLTGVGWVLIYALTGFWSTDKETWSVMLQMKLPVLLLPLSFSFLPRFTARQLQVITIGLGFMLFGGACYSLSFLLGNMQHYVQEYNVSHMIPTPVYRDYICFSSSIAIYIVWSVYFWPQLIGRGIKWLQGFLTVFLVLYLHVLAAKSGLIELYLFIVFLGVYNCFTRKSATGLLIIISFPVLLLLGIRYIPTLRERYKHVTYSWYIFKAGDKTGKLGDLSRLISYDIAFKLIAEHPIMGVGTGDMLDAMKVGYAKWYPDVKDDTNKLIPHNQFLTVALGCGIPAMVLFAVWVFMPLSRLRKNRASFFFFMVWFLLLFQLMIEPFLEGQFGIFVYLFFLLLFRHVLPPAEEKNKINPVSQPAIGTL